MRLALLILVEELTKRIARVRPRAKKASQAAERDEQEKENYGTEAECRAGECHEPSSNWINQPKQRRQ
jgi:hypothetical protein